MFAGNGKLCGLDSDGDGYPDMGLKCDDQQCQQVAVCITVSIVQLLTDTCVHIFH